jgi:replicative DNA helicase
MFALNLSIIKRITWGYGLPGLLFSLDLPVAHIYEYLIASIAGFPSYKIRNSYLYKVQNERMLNKNEVFIARNLLEQLKDLPLEIYDQPDLNIDELCNKARELYRKKRIKIIYIDSVGRIKIDKTNQSAEEMIVFIVRKLKALALELNIPIIVPCLNWHVSNRAPIQEQEFLHYKELANSSDVIMFLDEYIISEFFSEYIPIKIRVSKNNHGQSEKIELMYFHQLFRFMYDDFLYQI